MTDEEVISEYCYKLCEEYEWNGELIDKNMHKVAFSSFVILSRGKEYAYKHHIEIPEITAKKKEKKNYLYHSYLYEIYTEKNQDKINKFLKSKKASSYYLHKSLEYFVERYYKDNASSVIKECENKIALYEIFLKNENKIKHNLNNKEKTNLKKAKDELELRAALSTVLAFARDDECATQNAFFKKYKIYLPVFNRYIELVKKNYPLVYEQCRENLNNKSLNVYNKAKDDIEKLIVNLNEFPDYKILDYYLSKPVYPIDVLATCAKKNMDSRIVKPLTFFSESFSGIELNEKQLLDGKLIKKINDEMVEIDNSLKEKVIEAIKVNNLPHLNIIYSQLLDYCLKGFLTIDDNYAIIDNRVKAKARKKVKKC